MGNHTIKIKSVENATHDVLRIVTNKPGGYSFVPGQATNLTITRSGWENKSAPFTFTSLPDDPYLEFIIKIYPEHEGLTNELQKVKTGDHLIIEDPWGSIEYKGEGLFIAGGAGITPFISILRDLNLKEKTGSNQLIFANKTSADIILKNELETILGKNIIHILSEEKTEEFRHGFVSKELIKKHLTNNIQKVYLCAPPKMMETVEEILDTLNISSNRIIKEGF